MTIDFTESVLLSALLAIVLPAGSVLAQDKDYLPPPTGPYQSSVVINAIEHNSNHETQVYRFPPADLAMPDREFYQPRDFESADQADAFAGRMPDNSAPPVNALENPAPAANSQSTPVVDMNASPWAAGQQQLPAAPANTGVWANPYGYPQYPYGYYNGYMPAYPVAPSPWAVSPPPAYTGR
jgi:hypothetical protein